MVIKILGSGCANCKKLEQIVRDIVKENNIDASVEKVIEIEKIMDYGVMSTPALIINDKVKVSGRIPGRQQIIKYIEEEK